MKSLTHHLMRRAATATPDQQAVVDRDRSVTYAQLDAATTRLAGAFLDAGLARHDRVGIWLDKSLEEVWSIFAASKAGGVFVPINALLFPEQVEHIVRDCEPTVLVVSRSRMEPLLVLLPRCPSVRAVFVAGGWDRDREGSVEIRSMERAVADDPAQAPRDVGISRDLAAILYTSGSTGKPKGVMLSHANLIAGSRIVSTYLGITDRERILSVLPFSFDYGLNQLLTAVHHGATLVLITFRFPNEVVKAIVTHRITGLAGVPPFWNVFTQSGSSVWKTELPTLRYITNSGGAVPKTLLDNLRRALPTTDVFLMYGLTEAFRSTYLPPSEIDRRPGSMGKAIPDTEIFVVGEDGRELARGEVGELVHRGPTVSLGYWGRPEETARVIRPNPRLLPQLEGTEMVCYSGDLVRMDEDGYLYFVGRRDATIKCAGFRISPTEVEEIVLATGLVREAAAVGVPDDLMGQAVVVAAVARDGAPFDEDEVIVKCAEHMPRYMVPRRVLAFPALPRNPNGKMDYPNVRKSVLAALGVES